MREHEPAVERRPPEEVFGLLDNDLRVRVLRALATEEKPTPFSTLRNRVGESDSGRFNYHLRRLVGTFVRETDGGYELTLAGRRIVGALIAGTYTADATVPEIEVADPCPRCDTAPLHASYGDDMAQLTCPHCDDWRLAFTFPPGALDQYDASELPEAFDRWLRSLFERLTAGFCDNCAARLDATIEESSPPRLVWTCDWCGSQSQAAVAAPFVFHPAVEGFLYEHGLDPTTTPSWRLLGTDRLTQRLTESGAVVRLEADGETISGRVDTDGTVSEIERTDRSTE